MSEGETDKGWISKRTKKGPGMGALTVEQPEEDSEGTGGFNLSDTGSYREGLLHISQAGTTIHGPGGLAQMAKSPDVKGSTSAKRTHKSEIVRYELRAADFQNMEVIGKGSSGFVRKALWKSKQSMVAIKVINVFEAEKRKQMMQEILMMCDMHCDSLINFEGAFYNEGTINVVLENMTAGSLEDLVELSGKGIPETIMAYMAEQIVDGMAFMHAKKQIHRDFKPCNVLVHHNGRVKISDFGVSAELDSSLVKCTTFVGTFLYMSPERFGSEPYSFPSDIWSLGLTLMQCATGEYPYLRNSGKTYWELMEVIVQKEAPTLPANGFSSGLETFLSSCLQKDPKSRPTAQELRNHPFIASHCATTPKEERLKETAEFVGKVRSCFVSSNAPSSTSFSASDLAINFAYFYMAYFQKEHRDTLWSLYEESIELSVGQQLFNGRDKVMDKLMSVEEGLMIAPSEDNSWSKTAEWDSEGLVMVALTIPCILKGGKNDGKECNVEFDLRADLKRKCWVVTRQSLPIR